MSGCVVAVCCVRVCSCHVLCQGVTMRTESTAMVRSGCRRLTRASGASAWTVPCRVFHGNTASTSARTASYGQEHAVVHAQVGPAHCHV